MQGRDICPQCDATPLVRAAQRRDQCHELVVFDNEPFLEGEPGMVAVRVAVPVTRRVGWVWHPTMREWVPIVRTLAAKKGN